MRVETLTTSFKSSGSRTSSSARAKVRRSPATKLIRSEVRNEAAARRDRLIALGASEDIVRGLVRLFELDGIFGLAALAARKNVDELSLTRAYTKLGVFDEAANAKEAAAAKS